MDFNAMTLEFPTVVPFLADSVACDEDRRGIDNGNYLGKVCKRVAAENVIERLRDEVFEGGR
jgi:hypothetical protein